MTEAKHTPGPPKWIPADEEPEDFNTQEGTGGVNTADYRGWRYHWNSPRASVGQKAGWSRGSPIEKSTGGET